MTKRHASTTSSPPTSNADLRQTVAIVAAFAMVTIALIAFVRLKSLQVEAGYRVHDLRSRLVVLDQQRAALEVERAALARPHRLAQLARTTLGLVPPDVSTTTTAASLSGALAPSTAAPLSHPTAASHASTP